MTDAKPDTWMPLVIGDYLKDTQRLTTEQHGAYLLLIMSYWTEGPPLDDDEELAAITGLDARSWKKHRPKLERFFRIEDGRWRHKRVDEELERWAAKKALYTARAAAGGRAKAAKSTASSTPQAAPKQEKTAGKGCLNPAPQPASREVDALIGQSTLSGRQDADERADGSSPPSAWRGPVGLLEAVVERMGPEWATSWLLPCEWDEEAETLLAPRDFTVVQLERNVRKQLVAAKVSQVRVKGRAA